MITSNSGHESSVLFNRHCIKHSVIYLHSTGSLDFRAKSAGLTRAHQYDFTWPVWEIWATGSGFPWDIRPKCCCSPGNILNKLIFRAKAGNHQAEMSFGSKWCIHWITVSGSLNSLWDEHPTASVNLPSNAAKENQEHDASDVWEVY